MPTFRRPSGGDLPPEALPPSAPADPLDSTIQQLDRYTTPALQTMAATLGLRVTGNNRRPYLSALAQLVTSPSHLDLLQVRLTPQQWELLGLLPVRVGSVGLKSLIVALHQRGVAGKAALEPVTGLLAHGALLPTLTGMPANRLGIDLTKPGFTGMYDQWELAPSLDDWADEFEAPPFTAVDPPATVRGSALHPLQRAVFVVTAEAGRKPIKLTTAGVPYKADLTRLTKALASAGPGASGGEEALSLLYFTLATAIAAGLLTETSGVIQPSDRCAEFLDAPLPRQVAILLTGWATGIFNDLAFVPTLTIGYGGRSRPFAHPAPAGYSYGPDTEDLVIGRNLVMRAMLEGIRHAPHDWFAFEELARSVMQQMPEILYPRENEYQVFYPHYYQNQQPRRVPYPWVSRGDGNPARPDLLYLDTDWPEVEGAWIRQVVGESMRWLGLVEVDEPPPGGQPTRFHLTDLGRHLLIGAPLDPAAAPVRGRVVVQPNFDVVVVDAAANWNLLAQLDAFAERRSLDRAATYRLTQAALVHGLDQGWTGDRVLTTLEAATGSPLPQNVRFSLQEWIARYESLRVRERATLLEASDACELERWLADRQLGPLLGKRLSPTVVLVPQRQQAAVTARLRDLRQIDYLNPPRQVLDVHEPDCIEVDAGALDPYLRYRLDGIADRQEESRGRVVYRLTAAAGARARELGWTGTQLLSFLQGAARSPLPPEVVARLLGWSGAVAPLRSEALVALQLASARPTWSELRHIAAIGTLILAVPTPTLALVALDDLELLRAELASRGIAIEPHRLTNLESTDRNAALRAALAAFPTPADAVRELRAQGYLHRTGYR